MNDHLHDLGTRIKEKHPVELQGHDMDEIEKLVEEAENTSGYQFESLVIDITERATRLMLQHGVDRAELARRIGRSKNWVRGFLAGSRKVRLYDIVLVFHALGYELDVAYAPDSAQAVVSRDTYKPESKLFWMVCQRLETDFEPYGNRSRDEGGADCSCDCKYAFTLDYDWLICLNPNSPRAGLLTWEHQGCEKYEY